MPLEFIKPSPKLMRELVEVATAANDLKTLVSAPNFPLTGFPADAVKEICVSLETLPDGTAEGCREPLIYARKGLPAIRREYIEPWADEVTFTTSDSSPNVSRGNSLDMQLNNLIGSVTTALDQYQSETHIDIDDDVDLEKVVDVTRIANREVAFNRSQKLDITLQNARLGSAQLADGGIENADILGRQFADAESQNRLARVELTRKAARVTWLQPLVDQLQKMPEIIERTGELIQRSVEFVETTILISKPLRDRWKSYKMNSFTFALSEIKDTGSALQATAREMKRIRDSRKVVMQNDDFNLERVRDLILKGNSPPQRWIFRIESLNFENYSTLRDVSPLKNLTELKELYLGRTSVIDLSPLSYLSKLRILTLNETRVIDFYTLSLLKMLEILNLSKTQIRDLSPLSKLGRLKTVDLSHTRVANIEPLAGALALESLDVRDSRVRDFAALNELSRLRVVFVSSLDAATAVDRALGRVGIASM